MKKRLITIFILFWVTSSFPVCYSLHGLLSNASLDLRLLTFDHPLNDSSLIVVWSSMETIAPPDNAPNHHAPIPPERLSNKDYAAILQGHGWPADLLNTAAGAEYLSDEEKNIILAMNLIRHDPVKYAELYVRPFITFFRGKELMIPGLAYRLLTAEGDLPAKELLRELARAEATPLFHPSEGLSRAAKSHARHQRRTGQTGHGGQGGTRSRAEREGSWLQQLAENIAYGNPNAHYAILMLMIDDGVPDRGHRVTMLKPELKVAGTAWDTHPRYQGGVYVIKYAGGFAEK